MTLHDANSKNSDRKKFTIGAAWCTKITPAYFWSNRLWNNVRMIFCVQPLRQSIQMRQTDRQNICRTYRACKQRNARSNNNKN